MQEALCLAVELAERADERLTSERLEALFDTHHLRLYRLARRLSGDAEEARDLVQQTFLRAARRPDRIPDGDPAGEAWLVRVLVNLCRDRRRRLQVRARTHFASDAVGDGVRPHDSAAVARATVETALASLSPRRRAVIVMHEIEGWDIRDIARSLGLAQVTVRWHLAAGRRDLRRVLVQPEGGPVKGEGRGA